MNQAIRQKAVVKPGGVINIQSSELPVGTEVIESQVAQGKYASVDEVFLAGIKLLEERERQYLGRFEELRREVMVGVCEAEQGELLDAEAVITGLQEKLRQRRVQSDQ